MRIIAIALTAAALCIAQSPAFEVASVKVNHSGSGRASFPGLRNGTLRAENVPMRLILQDAYSLNSLQITGPGWIDSDRFDLSAKSPDGVPDTELMPMLQALLKERFHLVAHRESREMPVYNMVVTKDGVKFSAFDPAHLPPTPPRNGADGMIIGPMTMDQLAGSVTRAAGRPVLNRTGLEGRCFCAVTFSSLSAQASGNATDSAPPDIFAAVQQQLGLKLEPAKTAVEILVVDSADRVPTEN